MTLSKEEINRYCRQICLNEIGIEGQIKLKNSKVLVVGAGGLGCPVLLYLTAAGVGTLGILDYDWIDETNLQRQVLYNVNDLGKPKPIIAKEKLLLLNPGLNIIPYFEKLTKQNAIEILKSFEIIVDCTDNFAVRYLINDTCVILNKPIIYGAIHQFEGQVTVLNYNNGPTLRCLYPEPPDPLEVPSCEEAGIIGSVAGIIGAMQANETIKIITGAGKILSGRLFIINTLNFNINIFDFERNAELSDIKELRDYEDYCSSEIDTVEELSANELKVMISKEREVQIIDLSDPGDKNDFGFNCINIPSYEIPEKICIISKIHPVVFYCKYGIKSSRVISYLKKKHNFSNLYSLRINVEV